MSRIDDRAIAAFITGLLLLIAWQKQTKANDEPVTKALAASAANLREIVSTIHTFHGMTGHYPAEKLGWGYDSKTEAWVRDRPNLSWRVALLPLLGQKDLFERFNLAEPWDSEDNRKLIPLMPEIYRAPGSKADLGKTNYLAALGPDAAFQELGTIEVPDFVDGTSMTIMLVEVADEVAVEWTRPVDFPVDTREPVAKLVGLRERGFLAAFADGAPHFISWDIAPETLELLFCRNDRQLISRDDLRRWSRSVQGAR